MRLFRRNHKDEHAEMPCPRCKVPVPADDMECNVCGWDLHEQYRNEGEEDLTGASRRGMLDG